MNTVQPIRDKNKIEQMKTELLKSGYRNYMIFVIGINTGLRISDILKLTVSDVKDKTHIMIKIIFLKVQEEKMHQLQGYRHTEF